MSKISIITINYNNLEGLKKTVESVVRQTWQELEYIVIDGGSTDGSREYIESQSAHFDYWVSEPDKGIYNAMNKGIDKATGEYLLFLNSGDHFFNDEVLLRNHEFLVEKDLVYFNLNVIGGNQNYVKEYTDELTFTYFMKDSLPHPATFIKATLFEKVGLYDEGLKIVSDWKFFIVSICTYNSTYIRINHILSTFYLDGLSSDYQNKNIILEEKNQVLQSSFKAFIEEGEELIKLKGILSNLRKSRKINLLIRLGLINKF